LSETDLDLHPPSPERVAARAIVLSAVACRGLIEKDASDSRAEDLRQRVLSWIQGIGAYDEAEEHERGLLSTPLGSLSEKDTVDASWKSEGMAVLGWALGLLALPAYDQECEPSDSANRLGFLEDRISTPLAEPHLRSTAEIEHWTDAYLTPHWRLRQYSLHREAINFESYVQSCTWGPLSRAEFQLIDGDLAIAGSRLDRVPDPMFRRALSIAQERHQAFNWLIGEEPTYSLVTTDT
jgi:hypothetical protein